MVAPLRVTLEDASPVRSLTPLGGSGGGRQVQGGEGGPEGLLALGGGPEEQPDGLALVPLPQQGGEEGDAEGDEGEPVRLKWVGHVLGVAIVPPPGAIDAGEGSDAEAR